MYLPSNIARMQLYPSTQDGWLPDVYTIRWAFGYANERRIMDTIRDDVEARAGGLDPKSDEYWLLVSEVAIEAVLYDLATQAEELGVDFTPRDVNDAPEGTWPREASQGKKHSRPDNRHPDKNDKDWTIITPEPGE